MLGTDFYGSKLPRLPLEFYTRTEVVQIARELLGARRTAHRSGLCWRMCGLALAVLAQKLAVRQKIN